MAAKSIASFWMLWNEKRELPVVKHKSLKLAMIEAKRLSEKQAGDVFYLLQAVKIFFKAKGYRRIRPAQKAVRRDG